jgi:hypothetical protein
MKSLKDVKDFRYMTRRRDIAATIDIVEVFGDAGGLPSFNAVQGVLRRTTNISCLTLIFSFEPALRVLPTTQVFNNLTDLNVNAPHTAVAQFLINHSSITSLAVGACRSSFCPLMDCPLPLLQALTCPPGCVRAVTDAAAIPLTQLTVTHGTSDQDARFPLLQLFDFTYIPTSSTITSLEINIDHQTSRLLQRISEAVPALHVLRLTVTESPSLVGVRHSFFKQLII